MYRNMLVDTSCIDSLEVDSAAGRVIEGIDTTDDFDVVSLSSNRRWNNTCKIVRA